MKKKCRFVSLFLCLCVVMLFPSSGGTHSGGLDSNGGHYNRKTGDYHYHRGSGATSPTPKADRKESYRHSSEASTDSKSSISITDTEKEKRINEYFRNANENVGALDCGVVIHARDVSEATKNGVRWGQGNKCIICGSTVKLEVDHRRALMNGGTNDILNLALLCDDCHTAKTKYDNSLRRKRESVCRGK